MSTFPEAAWWEDYRDELLADDEFVTAATYFPVRLEFRHGAGSTTLDVRDGRVVSVTDGPHPLGSDIALSAPDAEWQRVLDGETDFFRGTSPIGEIEVSGDGVGAMRNVKALDRAVAAMPRVGRGPVTPPEPSPPPQPSGREVVGRYVDVDGLSTYIEEAGDGPTTVICFHAACQDTMMYRHVVAGLSDEFRVISVDAPSHGKTAEPADGEFRSLTRHAEFDERLMEVLGLERPVIVGCSMGGNLVLELGARRPDAYAAIISCEGADYTPTVSQHLLDMLLLNGQQILECWSESLTGDRTPPDRAREVVWQIRRCNPEVMAGDLTGYAGFDKREEVGAIRSPVLLLRGDGDWLVSQEQVEATAERIPGSEIAVLAGTGHYPMIENPYEFNESLRTFIRAATSEGSTS